jgi:hypothetical protein
MDWVRSLEGVVLGGTLSYMSSYILLAFLFSLAEHGLFTANITTALP